MQLNRSLFFASLALLAVGCDKKPDPAPTTKTEPAANKAQDKANEVATKKDGKKAKKKAQAKPADAKKTAMKGGDPATKDKPAASRSVKKVDKDEAPLTRRVASASASSCEGVAEGAGYCDGDVLYTCTSEGLSSLNCNSYEQDNGYDSGTCYETATDLDCYGATTTEGGPSDYVVYCNGNENTCCDSDGYCWDDTSGGDDNE